MQKGRAAAAVAVAAVVTAAAAAAATAAATAPPATAARVQQLQLQLQLQLQVLRGGAAEACARRRAASSLPLLSPTEQRCAVSVCDIAGRRCLAARPRRCRYFRSPS